MKINLNNIHLLFQAKNLLTNKFFKIFIYKAKLSKNKIHILRSSILKKITFKN